MYKKLLTFFLDLLFPLECQLCGKSGLLLCRDCLDMVPIRNDVSKLPSIDQVFIACDYTPEIQKIVWSLKYANVILAAEPLAELMAKRLENCILPSNTYLVPIPMQKNRQRQRGYNQAELLALRLSKRYQLPVKHILKRVSSNQRQAKLSRHERLKNIKNAFKPLQMAEDSLYILIDDVITTGSTVSEAAHNLRLAGAQRVWAVAVTRNDQSIRFHSREKDLPENLTHN